nr:hypothetical protein [Streptomyces sp. SID11385]
MLGLGGHRQVSALIHTAYADPEVRLWVPLLVLAEAERERPGLSEHVGQLNVLHTLDVDYTALHTVAELVRDGTPWGVAAAVQAVRALPVWHLTGSVATVDAAAYEQHTVPVVDLLR